MRSIRCEETTTLKPGQTLLEKPVLSQLARQISETATLPPVALRVVQAASDPDSAPADLEEVIQSDAALGARVLRCVNSSAYALRTKITNLQRAIAYLGLKQIRNLAMAASVSQMFTSQEAIGPYRRSELWRHLVSVAICARLIAMRRGFANFEEMFLGGLLHDIGIILEDQEAHEQFRALCTSLDPGKTLVDSEREVFSFDHTVLGLKAAQMWGFPEPVKASIRYHHMSAGYQGEAADVVRCVEAANVICTFKGIASVGVKLVRLSRAAFSELGLNKDDVVVLGSDLDRELAENAALLTIGASAHGN